MGTLSAHGLPTATLGFEWQGSCTSIQPQENFVCTSLTFVISLQVSYSSLILHHLASRLCSSFWTFTLMISDFSGMSIMLLEAFILFSATFHRSSGRNLEIILTSD